MQQALKKTKVSGIEVDRDAVLDEYAALVEKLERDGVPQEMIDEHAASVAQVSEAMGSRQLRIDIGKRLQWDRNTKHKGRLHLKRKMIWPP